MGPRYRADSVGGDVFSAASISLVAPIPRINQNWPFRIQFFINGGSLLSKAQAPNYLALARELL